MLVPVLLEPAPAPGGAEPALVLIHHRLNQLTSLPPALWPSVCEALVLHCTGVQQPEQHLGKQCSIPLLALLQAAQALSDASYFAATAAVIAVLQQAFLAGKRLPVSQPNRVLLSTSSPPQQVAVAGLMPTADEQALQDALVSHWPRLAKLAPSGAAAAMAAEAAAAASLLYEHAPAPPAAAVAMPYAAVEWIAAGGLLRLHAAALQRPSEMLRGHEGLAVQLSRSVDFGMQELQPAVQQHCPTTIEPVSNGHVARSGQGHQHKEQHAPAAAQLLHGLLFREITITNSGSRPVWLLNVCLVPEYHNVFSAVDDHGICCSPAQLQLQLVSHSKRLGGGPGSDSLSSTDSTGPKAVLLGVGQEHRVTVVLQTSSNAAQQHQETGLLEQFVLVTVLQEGGTRPFTPGLPHDSTPQPATANGATSSSNSAADTSSAHPGVVPLGAGKDPMQALVLGRRCSAALLDKAGAAAVQGLLSADAKPFVPAQLRMLFDHQPQQFYASPGNKLRCIWGDQGRGAVNRKRLGLPFLLQSQLPGTAPVCAAGNTALRRASYLSKRMWQIPPYVRCLVRLLTMEELAMERDMHTSYALYSVRMPTAVFMKSGGSNSSASRQYSVQEWPCQPEEAQWQSDQPIRRYRGPSLQMLVSHMPTNDMATMAAKPMLAVLHVPGLPEHRPDLLPGDVVYVRPAAANTIEYAGHVLSTDGSNCLVLMAQAWWDDLARGKYGNATRKLAPMVHARFTFHRSSMHHMAEALIRLPQCQRLLLPPEFLGGQERPAAEALATPEEAAAIQQASNTLQLCGSTPLNPEQKLAVATVLHGGGLPYVVFGPPGTGKTITLVEAVCQWLLQQPTAKVLCCAPQNYSADLICCALAASSVKLRPGDMLRLNDARRAIAQAKQESLPFCLMNEPLGTFRMPTDGEINAARVIICSCSTAGLLPSQPSFDFVCMDEAGQAVIPEALIPLTLAKPHSSIMLCGDPRQLSPIVRCPTAALHGLATSLLELLINYHTARAEQLRAAAECAYAAAQAEPAADGAVKSQRSTARVVDSVAETAAEAAAGPELAAASAPQQPLPEQQAGEQAGTEPRRTPPVLINTEYSMLVRNYRSHSALLDLPSRLFYGGELIASADPTAVAAPAWHRAAAAQNDAQHGGGNVDGDGSGNGEVAAVLPYNMLFFGVRGQQLREGDAPSFFNPIEAVTLADLVQSLLEEPAAGGRRPVTVNDIGIIATYRKQVQKIRLLLRERGLGAVRVGTTDDFQGQEARIIFISTVLSKPEALPAALGAKALSVTAGPRPWLAEGSGDGDAQQPELHLGLWNNPKRFNVAITRAKALLVVVGSPLVLMKDANWKELLRHAAARGAYRGAGLSHMQALLRTGAAEAGSDPLGSARSAADADEHAGAGDDAAAAELAAAVKQIAELAQLGIGDVDRLYPETPDEFYESCADELQWRVAL